MLSNIACISIYVLIAITALAMRGEVKAEARDADIYEDAEGWEDAN